MVKEIIYPDLSGGKYDFAFFRLGGAGLANCLFVAARAAIIAKKTGAEMLRPTWERFGLGQFLRREKDKRLYRGLFKGESFCATVRRLWHIATGRYAKRVSGLGSFFNDIIDDYEVVREYFREVIEPQSIAEVPESLKSSVAVHVRLGDYPQSVRTPISWYVKALEQIQTAVGQPLDIQVFSDGKDEELAELLQVPGAHRVFYGNALADIIAISRCGLLVAGTNSTFSAWGAYLGQVPCLFRRMEYGRILRDESKLCSIGDACVVPAEFLNFTKGILAC